ncbi:hypothetical protein D3C85_870570 [compost metagenome]
MQSINELKAKQARELADLEAHHAFAKLLPVMPYHVNLTMSTGTPCASIKVEGIGGALEALKAFTIVPFTEYRDGSTLRLEPMTLIRGIDKDKYADQWAVSVRTDTNFCGEMGPHTSVKVWFYARIEGAYQANGMVCITLDVNGPDYIGNFKALAPSCEYTSNARTQVKRGSIRPNAALNGYCDRFHSWSVPGNRALYDFLIVGDYADQDATGPKQLSHLFGQLQNMSDEFDRGAK